MSDVEHQYGEDAEKFLAKELIEAIRRTRPDEIAAEILAVQSMPPDIFARMTEESMSESELIKNGYKPVSSFNLMWVKEESTYLQKKEDK
jgi:hypothetical protein